jgi:hypothetical protein
MKVLVGSLCAAAVALLVHAPLAAHHSFAAEFDAEKPVSLTGVVTRLEWTNPHAHVHIDVGDQHTGRASWNVELGTPNDLMRRGWLKESVKPGDVVTVNGYPAKDGGHRANARSVVLADGRTIFARSSAAAARGN